MTQSSFYADGEVLDAAVVESNDAPASTETTTAPSSFYPDGTAYDELKQADSVLAAVQAALVAAQAAQAASEAAANASDADRIAAQQAVVDAVAVLSTALLKANNLSDLTNVAQAKLNLSLVKGDVGLGNVDNTSDANKPVSTAQQTALNLKANIASPTFTGVPAAPTAAPGTNTTQLATTAFVEAARVILAAADALKAPLASPALTGTPTAPTAAPGTNTTQLATTAFVEAARVILAAATALKANIASPTFTGTPSAPTAAGGTNTTQIATTAFVEAVRVALAAADATKAPLASPALTGTPTAPTPAAGNNSTQIATTAYVVAADATKAPLASPALTGVPTAPTAANGTNTTQIATTAFVLANAGSGGGGGHGQCVLVLSGGNLVLRPKNGNQLKVNGATCTVPDAGVSLAPTGFTPTANYYVYAVATAGVITSLEASATSYAASTAAGNKGVVIKSGDDTRTLVGFVRCVTGPAWADTTVKRFVRSWFNDPGVNLVGAGALTNVNTTASATYVEMSTNERVEFLIWAGEVLNAQLCGYFSSNGAGGSCYANIGLDGAAPAGNEAGSNPGSANFRTPFACYYVTNTLSEGYHFLTPLLAALSAGSAFFYGPIVGGAGTRITADLRR